ncbi:MAG TPA: YfiR family protein [Steroidobacteraceae bacterium]|nr:YfiR family protein [Steroidobacteraceae bacterium]
MSTGARFPTHQCSARRLPGWWRLPSLLLACALACAGAARAQTGATATFPEDAVKAIFLYRFAGYVQWPMTDAQTNFVLAVMGADDVAARLQSLLADHPIHGLPAEVHRIHGLKSLGTAQVLYIGPDYDGNLAALTARLRGRPVLVVTDRDGALDTGSVVNFLMQSGHVRFEVSMVAARQAGLTISSELLAVAQRVKTGSRSAQPLCVPLASQRAGCARRVATR